jgi:hypothetical protein
MTWLRLGAAMLLALAAPAGAAERPETMQSARERAAETAPGPWQGNWVLLRDDPRIRTRGGAIALRLQVIHDAAGPVELEWVGDRALCEDPVAPPCEWVGAAGRGVAAAAGPGALAVLLRVSADPDDPFLLVLERSGDGRATARLVSEKGGLAYRLDAERE